MILTQTPKTPIKTLTKRRAKTIELAKAPPTESATPPPLSGKSYFAPFATKLKLDSVVANVVVAVNVVVASEVEADNVAAVVNAAAGKINRKQSRIGWKPIVPMDELTRRHPSS